jgi:ABC-type sulfate transport system substrate-binding protein
MESNTATQQAKKKTAVHSLCVRISRLGSIRHQRAVLLGVSADTVTPTNAIMLLTI